MKKRVASTNIAAAAENDDLDFFFMTYCTKQI